MYPVMVRFFVFFQNRPQIFAPAEILSLNSSTLPIAMEVGSKDAPLSAASFALLFVKKLCNSRIKRQDLRREVVDSKMLLFYRSQIGQCSNQIPYLL